SGYKKDSLSFSSCKFEKWTFMARPCRMARFIDIIFKNCDFSLADLGGSSFIRVEFTDCKLSGTNLSEGTFNQVLFNNCHGKYSLFNNDKFTGTSFSSCDLQGVVLDECKLHSIYFDACNLSEAEFYYTPLKGVDFRTSVIDRIRLNGPELKGAIVNSFQAADLARILGVIIEDQSLKSYTKTCFPSFSKNTCSSFPLVRFRNHNSVFEGISHSRK
ncbi:MAG: pentapeptide repeat-containing protein, partial [Tannerellaceae bacterium]|nr:pentapeptide repeat-containing protein [Tannerellaceae bacterium]